MRQDNQGAGSFPSYAPHCPTQREFSQVVVVSFVAWRRYRWMHVVWTSTHIQNAWPILLMRLRQLSPQTPRRRRPSWSRPSQKQLQKDCAAKKKGLANRLSVAKNRKAFPRKFLLHVGAPSYNFFNRHPSQKPTENPLLPHISFSI